MPKYLKYMSSIEVDVNNAWEEFQENCLEGIDNDFVLKLCRISFISGMIRSATINSGFAISLSEYMHVVAQQNSKFEIEEIDED